MHKLTMWPERLDKEYHSWRVKVLGARRGTAWTFFELIDLRGNALFQHYFIDRELATLLPSVTAEMYQSIGQERRRALYESTKTYMAEYALELVKLFERARDADALPCVRRLAEGRGTANLDSEVADAAALCAAVLEVAWEERRASRELLRPSEAPSDELLLHPAAEVRTPENELLRPAIPSDES